MYTLTTFTFLLDHNAVFFLVKLFTNGSINNCRSVHPTRNLKTMLWYSLLLQSMSGLDHLFLWSMERNSSMFFLDFAPMPVHRSFLLLLDLLNLCASILSLFITFAVEESDLTQEPLSDSPEGYPDDCSWQGMMILFL